MGGFPHNQLNGVENDTGEIQFKPPASSKKIGLAKVEARKNNRGPMGAVQRAGRKKLVGKCRHSAAISVGDEGVQ